MFRHKIWYAFAVMSAGVVNQTNDVVYFEYAGQVVHLVTVKVIVKIQDSCGRFVRKEAVGDSPTHTPTTINLTTALAITKSTSHPITHNTNSKRITLTATISSISTTIAINIMCNNMVLRQSLSTLWEHIA